MCTFSSINQNQKFCRIQIDSWNYNIIDMLASKAWKSVIMHARMSSYRSLSSALVKGHATAEGTKAFINVSNLPFHHILKSSSLSINPIIHGPPKLPALPTDVVLSKMDADRNLAKAIAKHRNNCVYVYEHHPRGAWHSNVVSRMVSEHQAVRREEIVAVAGLGEVDDVRELRERLADACRFSGLETIDMAIIEVMLCSNHRSTCILLLTFIFSSGHQMKKHLMRS
jgi:hypothetical protein